MKLATTAPLALDPTLPWLRTDPAMQRPEAFAGMQTVQLDERGWAPMGLYFPGGTTLAMVQITKLEDMTPGVYWHEYTPANPEMFVGVFNGVIYSFGRFEGFGELNPSEARRHKQGRAHFQLGSDTLDCNLRQHYLCEDGTTECYVNFGSRVDEGGLRKLWRITHYVDMPAQTLAALEVRPGVAGLTADQQRWLGEEKLLQTAECCSEYSAHAVSGLPEADCRAVLRDWENRNFSTLFHYLPRLLPSQAKKCKPGAVVAITFRSYAHTGKPIGYTHYFKRADARVLLDLLQSQADVARLAARLTASSGALKEAAARVRDTINARVADEMRELRGQPALSYELAEAA